MYTSIDNLKDEKFVFERIDSNFRDIVGQDYIQEEKPIVKNLLIKNNKIYVLSKKAKRMFYKWNFSFRPKIWKNNIWWVFDTKNVTFW